MRKRNISPKEKTQQVKREKDPIPWRYCLLTLVCGLLLVVGFFWAARQHFSAMDLGIKNAKLRQQKESLEAEARRLYLSKEILLSPAEIKKAAKKLGFQEITAENFEVVNPSKTEEILDETPQHAALKNSKSAKTEVLKKVEKTALVEKTEEKVIEVKTKDGKSKAQTLPVSTPRTQIAKK